VEAIMGRDIMELPAPPAGLRVAYGSHPLQFGELRLPIGSGLHPLAVVLHGGFWRARYDLTYIGHLCRALAEAGFATWNLEYRRIDLDGGWPHTMLDVGSGTDFARVLARQHPIDLARTITIGHSAGGHLALWLAGRRRIPAGDPLHVGDPLMPRGAISLAGVADLRLGWILGIGDHVVDSFMGASPDTAPNRYAAASPAELLPLGVPQALIHGTDDDVVPMVIAERYVERARSLGDAARLVALPGEDHFAPVDPRSPVWTQVLDAVRELSAPPA
jgi:acetyl esterase/lipase